MDQILVIDDSPVQAEFLRSLLVENYEVTICSTAAEGLEKAKNGGFSLILLDIIMPDMDGFTMLRRHQICAGDPDYQPLGRAERGAGPCYGGGGLHH